jgi:hypothetical protein
MYQLTGEMIQYMYNSYGLVYWKTKSYSKTN